jgi:CRISPR-associated protein Cmr3
MQIKLSAIDTMFFRTGKPFDRGEDNWAESFFPPFPSIIYGALRTYILNKNLDKVGDLKNFDISKNLKINSINLSQKGTIYYPLPLDLVKIKDLEVLEVENLKHRNNHISNFPCEQISYHEQNIEIPNALLTKTSFESYLDGEERIPYVELNKLYKTENKVGVGLDNFTRASEQSKLYRVGMLRTEDERGETTDLIIDFEFDKFEVQSKLLKLGAETKLAKIKIDEYDTYFQQPNIINSQFKLYFATPAIFDNGWLPDFIKPETLEGEFEGVKLKLITAFVGKPLKIGGYDMLENEPKPMFNAVSAGSVYYFKIISDGNLGNLVKNLHHKNISKVMLEQGFGHSIVLPLNAKFDE